MPRIAVFDSGLGSLSIVRELRRAARSGGGTAEIIYYADTASFPYGSKPRAELGRIVSRTISGLRGRFAPDAVVIASNTPCLVLDIRDGRDNGMLVAGVRPPLAEAARLSGTGRIGILGTASGIRGAGLSRMIREYRAAARRPPRFFRIDGSELVRMVETGLFLRDAAACRAAARRILDPAISGYGIDAVTLSSTHLPFLADIMGSEYPGVQFVNPARNVAKAVLGACPDGTRGRNSLRVYASGDCAALQDNLQRLRVRRRVRPLLLLQ